MFTRPRYVVRKCGAEDLYMQPGGAWGDYTTAKRFGDQDKADTAALHHGHEAYGLFPCSLPRPLHARKG